MDAPTLGDLLDVLGGSSVRAVAAPAGLGGRVGEILLYDADAALPHAPGAVLLAVGVRPPAAGPLLHAAAAAGMAAVV
ncbi:PucR family transcriptional regulator, partial [Streptomyces sp. NPDC002690]